MIIVGMMVGWIRKDANSRNDGMVDMKGDNSRNDGKMDKEG